MVKKLNHLFMDEADRKLIKVLIEENVVTKLMESYVVEEYEIVDYLVGELVKVNERIKIAEFKTIINEIDYKVKKNDYSLDKELDQLREIINIIKIQHEI